MSTTLQVIGVKPSRTSLNLEPDLGFNEWREVGDQLTRMADASNWWVGDWLTYGDRYRRDYTTAMHELDLKYSSLVAYAYVASKVESSTRVEDLSWSHHRLVAPLDAQEQRYWLDEALRHGWTVKDLEQALGEARGKHAPPAAFTVRAVGELHELCVKAAEHAGLRPDEWARRALEGAARRELEPAP